MDLDLEACWDDVDAGLSQEVVDLWDVEVGDTNGLSQTRLVQLLHDLVSLDVVPFVKRDDLGSAAGGLWEEIASVHHRDRPVHQV